jgi:hypothetical protein
MKALLQPMTVNEIATLVEGQTRGDGNYSITHISEVTSATANAVASFHNMKYAAAAQTVPAGCLLIPPAAANLSFAAHAQIVVDNGNTVVVIEHNLDIIKSMDYLVDIGPEGGEGGGNLVAKGTPEEVANSHKSYTGQYLKKALKK